MRDKGGSTRTKGVSLAKGPAWLIGLALLALGITGLLFGSTSFSSDPLSGTANGSTWLGIEGNGWTWVLFGATGALLMAAAPLHFAAKSTALVAGLVLGAASVIALVDGEDVFGIFAANGPTKLVLGVAAAALLVIGLLPRVGGKDKSRRARAREEEPATVRSGRFDRASEPEEAPAAVQAGERPRH